ncbi:MAG: LPS-assembly protein LptD [Campylobacterales bacterium]
MAKPARFLSGLLIGAGLVTAQNGLAQQTQPVELIAQQIRQEGNLTRAEGDVLVREGGRFLRSDRLILCKDRGEAEFFGNVYLAQPNQDLLLSDYLKLNTGTQVGWVDNLFTLSAESGLWLSASEGQIEGNLTRVRSGSVSGCPAATPDWSIRFSSATHDRGDEWVDLFNGRFYAGAVPVFYLPYFGYSTNTQRRSGFLFPRFGQSSEEGFLFELPYYYAPGDTWDLEIWPQTRTRRGEGVAGTLRFVDSPHSKGALSMGRFEDKESFAQEKEVVNPDHWGGELTYSRSRLITPASSNRQEGLYIHYQDYSDVEYIQLESVDPDKRNREIDALITNKIDYFYKTDHLYGGLYSRHFKDLKNPEEANPVHILPESHGHLFTRPILGENLLISADVKHRNFERDWGVEATDWRLQVPVGYHLSLLDDYLLLSASWQADYYRIDYTEPGYENATHEQTQSQISLSTMVARPYETLFHTLAAGVSYTNPLTKKSSGTFDGNFSSGIDTGAVQQKTAALKLAQYFHTPEGLPFLTHRLSQPMIVDENTTLLDLENEFILQPRSDLSLSNRLYWSHEHDALINSSTTLTKRGALSYSLSYLYENKTGSRVTNRYLNANASYQVSRRHRFFGDFARDLLNDETRGWRVAHVYNKGCWQTELSFTRKNTPYTTAEGETDSTINDIIFLKLTLVPFGEMEQQLYERERS